MAISTTTTKNIQTLSEVWKEHADNTEKDMVALMKKAGNPKPKLVKALIMMMPGDKEDIQKPQLNGVEFYLRKNKWISMPTDVVELLQNCGVPVQVMEDAPKGE